MDFTQGCCWWRKTKMTVLHRSHKTLTEACMHKNCLCRGTLVNVRWLTQKRRNCLIKSILSHQYILLDLWNYSWITDVTWIIWTMSLLCFWPLNFIAVYGGSESSRISSKYLSLCSEERSLWVWNDISRVSNCDRIVIFGVNYPFNY